MKLRQFGTLFFSLVFLCITSCSSIGPQRIDIDRASYNDIVWRTDLEQLLTNIVRLRYAESSSYFQVTNVTASYSLVQTISGQFSAPDPTLYETYPTAQVSPSVVYSDSPTISYAPLGNAAFVASLEKPVNFNYFLLLSHGCHFDFNVLAKIMLSKVGPLRASISASSIDVYETPSYKPYYTFVDTTEEMIENETIIPKPIYFNKDTGMMLYFTNPTSPKALLLKKMVNVPADSDNIIILPEGNTFIVEPEKGRLVIPKPQGLPRNVIYAQTLSIESLLTFLSHGVQVPENDIKAHVTTESYYPDGRIFDWTPMMKGIITIYSSDQKPTEDVMIRTYVHGYWFYIKNSDIRSKKTLYQTIKLMDLVSVLPPQYQGPSLTLPG